MRYRWISASGEEISRDSLAELCNAVRSGDITAETLVKVGEDGRWTPGGRHPDVAPVLVLLRAETGRSGAPEQPAERAAEPSPDQEDEIVDAVIRPPATVVTAPPTASAVMNRPTASAVMNRPTASAVIDQPTASAVTPGANVVDPPSGGPHSAGSSSSGATSAPAIDRPVRSVQSVAIQSAFPVCWKLAIASFIGVTAIDIACYVFTDQMNEIARGHGGMAFWNAMVNIRIGVFALGGLCYMFAVPAAHEVLTAHGYSNFKIRPWVANVCLFVPLAGLVVPWMYWGDVRRESSRLADHGPFGDAPAPKRKLSGAALGLGLTFFCYIAGVGAVNSVLQTARSISAIQDAGDILIGLDVMFFGALWLYFRGINDLWRIGLVHLR